MFRIKKLNIFITKSFFTLFVGTFLICLFIFLMQFLWRWVDDLVGKGLGMDVLAKFFWYSTLTLVPLSMPLAVLLASLITFGNFGERFELLAMKASGISLLKVMRPLMVIVGLLTITSFYFQNVISPNAQKELGTFALSLKQKSPELDIPEGAFYNDIPGYNLRIQKKNKVTGVLHGVLIYDYSQGFENTRIINCDSGRLDMTADRQHLLLQLYKGELFENLTQQTMYATNVPYRRETFDRKTAIIEFNSGFNMADANVMSNQAGAKNISALSHSIDSMTVVGDSIGRSYYKAAAENYYRSTPMVHPALSNATAAIVVKKEKYNPAKYDIDKLYDKSTTEEKQRTLQRAENTAQNLGTDWEFKSSTVEQLDYQIRRHKIEMQRKITIALSCMLFFFIGAPLGGIIRKGGLGMPVVISVLVFIVYYIIDNSGYKMARDGKWALWMGIWLSTAVLAPLGAFLTYKSNNDSVVLNIDTYIAWLRRVSGIRSIRHAFMKEVIIQDVDYDTMPARLNGLSLQCISYLKTHHLRMLPNYVKLWMTDNVDNDIDRINNKMEELIDEMSNSHSIHLINALNNYPIIPTRAHTRPFHGHWLNIAAGVIIPVGIFFLLRIWAFRIRLDKDLRHIVENDKKIKTIILQIQKKRK
ncbi:MAG: YjgP/YjgQ family permease [Bacteroidales bacterium]|nr:YjgP/YjgQ family permease [Bacteroidales bacterium]